jgi:hypothetical protein
VTGPFETATGDFNGDGALDFVTVSTTGGTSSQLAVFLNQNDGHGTFTGPTTYGGNPYGVAVGDFNHDGMLDLVTGNYYDANGVIEVYLNAGAGLFHAGVTYPTPTHPGYVAVDDFNGDCLPDVATSTSGGIVIFQGTAGGTFVAYQVAIGTSQGGDLIAADFNHDGRPDFAWGDPSGVWVALNTSH